jgi:hypothetical protein
VVFPADDESSPTAHWRHVADANLVPVLTESVVAFASDRGMSPEIEPDLRHALSVVLVPLSREADADESIEPVMIDAAADGLWLAVRITHAGVRYALDAGGGDVLRRITDRLEIHTSGDAHATSVLMEFSLSRAG